MADSLRDQLLKSGLVMPKSRPPRGKKRRPAGEARRGGDDAEMDLAQAYAARARTERREREQMQREAAERARLRKERRQRLQELLAQKALNREDAEGVRNFEYGGRIRRIWVSDDQMRLLNQGELGVVQMRGRYLLVSRAVALQARDIDSDALALLVDPPSDPAGPEPGDDP